MNKARKVVEEAYEKYIKSNQADEEDIQLLNGMKEIQKKGLDEILFLLAEYSVDTKRAAFLSGFEAGIKAALELCKKLWRKRMRLIDADEVKEIICKHEERLVQRQMIYEVEKLKSYDNESMRTMIQDRIKELKNSRAGYMVCGISCNHAVVAELERLLKEIE